jgi:hypothetical protein
MIYLPLSRYRYCAVFAVLLTAALCASCGTERCSEPRETRLRMAYAFRHAVPQCMGCDPCWYFYWYFECDGVRCDYLSHFDPRDGQEEPDWLGRVREIEKCYMSTGYCSDKSWGYHTDPSLTPRESEEAEEAALWLSGSLVAPQELYEIVRDDLALIRATYRDSIPQVDTVSFQPYLMSNWVGIELSPDAYQQYTQGEYHDWDSLNTLYGLTQTRPGIHEFLYLIFSGRYNTVRLAELYKTLPSVWGSWPTGWAFICDPSTVIAWRIEPEL